MIKHTYGFKPSGSLKEFNGFSLPFSRLNLTNVKIYQSKKEYVRSSLINGFLIFSNEKQKKLNF